MEAIIDNKSNILPRLLAKYLINNPEKSILNLANKKVDLIINDIEIDVNFMPMYLLSGYLKSMLSFNVTSELKINIEIKTDIDENTMYAIKDIFCGDNKFENTSLEQKIVAFIEISDYLQIDLDFFTDIIKNSITKQNVLSVTYDIYSSIHICNIPNTTYYKITCDHIADIFENHSEKLAKILYPTRFSNSIDEIIDSMFSSYSKLLISVPYCKDFIIYSFCIAINYYTSNECKLDKAVTSNQLLSYILIHIIKCLHKLDNDIIKIYLDAFDKRTFDIQLFKSLLSKESLKNLIPDNYFNLDTDEIKEVTYGGQKRSIRPSKSDIETKYNIVDGYLFVNPRLKILRIELHDIYRCMHCINLSIYDQNKNLVFSRQMYWNFLYDTNFVIHLPEHIYSNLAKIKVKLDQKISAEIDLI